MNTDHFKTEDARIYQVYIYTESITSEYLYPRYKSNATDSFKTVQEIIIYLKQFFTNPYQVREARYKYQNLKIKTEELFFNF